MTRDLLAALAVAVVAACSSPPAPAPGAATGSAASTAAAPASTTGTVQHTKFHSDALGVDKKVVIYLPAGYDAHGAKRYPVFYYLHGLGGDETNWIDGGHLDAHADAMGLQAIVVMPDGDDSFYVDSPAPIDYDACMYHGDGLFFPERVHKDTCVRANKYETYMTKDLVGWVDATYHTIASRDGRAIAGLSMGGYGAFMLAMRHQDEFSAAASHSGVVSLLYAGPHPYATGHAQLIGNPKLYEAIGGIGAWIESRFGPNIEDYKARDPSALIATLEPGKLALYLDCGTEDDFKLDDAASYVDELLTARHIDHAFFEGPGAHNFKFWEPRLPFSLAYLRDHVAKAQ